MRKTLCSLWSCIGFIFPLTAAVAFDGGSGTADAPWQIASVETFKAFRDSVNAGTNYDGKTVQLTADLDLAWELWTPIGVDGDTSSTAFCGTFDGNGKTISNLVVSREAGYHGAGLFGAARGSVVLKDFTVENAFITNLSTGNEAGATVNGTAVVVGSFAYYEGTGKIENVSVKNAVVKGNRYVSAFVGYGQGTISGCTAENISLIAVPDKATGSYDNGDKVGGFVGYVAGNTTLENCTLAGTNLFAGYRDVGGIVGCCTIAGTLTNCKVSGSLTIVSNQEVRSYGTKDANIGAIIGRTGGSTTADSDCTYVEDSYHPYSGALFGEDTTGDAWYNGTYYATLGAAIDAANTADAACVAAIYCRPGGKAVIDGAHKKVTTSLVVFGNGATLSQTATSDETAEATLNVEGSPADTYGSFSRPTDLTCYDLQNACFWGTRQSANPVNLLLDGCTQSDRIYITGTTGKNHITLRNCTYDTTVYGGVPMYSNAAGSLLVEGCTFAGILCPINMNNKSTGHQEIAVRDSTFTDCATTDIAGDAVTYVAPIRAVASEEGASTALTIDGCTFSYAEGKAASNGDVLLGDGRTGKTSYRTLSATLVNTAAEVQIQLPGFRPDSATNNAIRYTVENTETPITLTNAFVAETGGMAYNTLPEAIEAAVDGGTVTLYADTSLSQTVELAKSLTLKGNGYTISAGSLSPAFKITAPKEVAFEQVNLTAKQAIHFNAGGVGQTLEGAKLTLTACTLSVSERGVSFKDGLYPKTELTLDGTVLNQSAVTAENKETQVVLDQNVRGLSLWNMTNSTVTIKNGSELNGFSYVVNVSGDANESGVVDTTGLAVNIEDSTLRGWAALNVWTSFATYTVKNSTLLGINISSASGNSFAVIVFNADIYNLFEDKHAVSNKLTIADSTVKNYRSGTCAENLIRVDCGLDKLVFSGTVNLTDTTGACGSALYLSTMSPDGYATFRESGVSMEGATILSTCQVGGETTDLPLWPSYTAYYYWDDGNGGYEGCFCDFAAIFTDSSRYTLYAGEYIDLLTDVTLTADIPVTVAEGAGTFTLNLKGHTVSGAKLVLAKDVGAVTDTRCDGLFAAAEGLMLEVSASATDPVCYTYMAKQPVAKDSAGTQYATLQAALDSVAEGETVTLLADLDLSSTGVKVRANRCTLDLNGKTLQVANTFAGQMVVTADLTLVDSTDTVADGSGSGKLLSQTAYSGAATGYTAVGCRGATFTMKSGRIETAIESDPTNKGNFAVGVLQGGTLDFQGGVVKAGWYAASSNGTDTSINTVKVSGTAKLVSTADYAIYWPVAGTVNVSGGTVFGAAGAIAARKGAINLSGGVVNSDGSKEIESSSGDGTSGFTKSAIYLTPSYGDVALAITGGTVTAASGIPVLTVSAGSYVSTVAISGGYFSQAVPYASCAAGYIPKTLSEGDTGYSAAAPYTVSKTFVAVETEPDESGNEQTFATLDDLLKPENDGTVVYLGDEVVLTNEQASTSTKSGTETETKEGATAKEVVDVLGGAFTVQSTTVGDTTTTTLVYTYNFGISDLKVSADTVTVFAKLEENGQPVSGRTLAGRTLTMTVGERTVEVANPTFADDGTCAVVLPIAAFTQSDTTTISVKVSTPTAP